MQKQMITLAILTFGMLSSAFGAGAVSKSSVTCTGSITNQFEEYGPRGMPVTIEQKKVFTLTVNTDQSYATTNGASQYDLSSAVLDVTLSNSETGGTDRDTQYYKCIYRASSGSTKHECAEENADRYAPYNALVVQIWGSTATALTQSYGLVSLSNCQ